MKNLPRAYYYLAILGLLALSSAVWASFSNGGEKITYVASMLPGGGEEIKIEEPIPVKHIKTPSAVKGIYMTSWVAGTKKWREELAQFVVNTEINSIVIDIKDYTGRVSFEVGDEELNSLGYTEKRIPDIKEFINYLHERDIYVIGRISVFQDPWLVKKRPELAVKNKAGAVWKDRKGISWIDPASKDAWAIAVKIGKESEKVGFDELNFDYIRFPSDGNMKDIAYPFWDGVTPKAEVMNSFYAYLDENFPETGIPISGDLFGLTSSSLDDLGIGQVLENGLRHFDFVSPMIYPSHYPATFLGFKNPADHPYEVIKSEMDKAVLKATAIGESPEKIRPWIQDFDLGADYNASMIRLQKKAIYDAGLTSWLVWAPSNK